MYVLAEQMRCSPKETLKIQVRHHRTSKFVKQESKHQTVVVEELWGAVRHQSNFPVCQLKDQEAMPRTREKKLEFPFWSIFASAPLWLLRLVGGPVVVTLLCTSVWNDSVRGWGRQSIERGCSEASHWGRKRPICHDPFLQALVDNIVDSIMRADRLASSTTTTRMDKE